MKPLIHFLSLTFLCAVTNCSGQGTLVAGHFGSTDPTSEGFTLVRGGNPSLTPVMNDLGLSAWSIGLDTNADIGLYRRVLTAQEKEALKAGWILSLTLRVLEPFGMPTPGIGVKLSTGVENIPSLIFGAQSDGDPILSILDFEYALEGAGSGYQNYQLRYDAGVGLASLWVDGALLLTDIAGSPNPSVQLSWGGGQRGPGSAYANWNEVSLWAIPEPSALTLLLLGSGAAACLRMRRVKRRRNQE